MQGHGAMIGRAGELEVLCQRLSEARSGRGAVVLVAGEAGIGKTTLAGALLQAARDSGMVTAVGRCREDGEAPPYRPWVQVLRAVLSAGDPELTSSLEPRLAELLESPAVAESATDGGVPDRFRLFEAMASVLASVKPQGVLAVVDDLHRADEASLAFLCYLAAELHELPLLVLGAYRDGEVGRDHLLTAALGAMADGGSLEVLPLRALPDKDVRALVVRHCESAISDQVVDRVVVRAEGNPFFAVEIARLLRSAPEPPSEVTAGAIPPTVREAITRRLARLRSESRRALEAAAVLGREFGQLPLSRTLGSSPVAVVAALQPAAAAGLISADRVAGYSFIHALVQEAVYEGLSPDERATLHRRAAAAISALERDDDDALSAVAYHSYRASFGGDAGPEAIARVLAAGRRARQRLAFEEAARWMACALELAGRTAVDLEYAALLCETADVEVLAGLAPAARSHYEAAAELARRRRQGDLLARAALGVGSAVVTAGQVDWALVELLEEADAATENQVTRAKVQSRRAIELYWHDGSEPSRQQSIAALKTAEASGSDDAIGVALHARQFTLRGPEHLGERIAIGERLVKLADRNEHADLSFQGAVWLAADVMRAADLPRFRALSQSLNVMAVRARRPLWRWYATVMQAQLAAVEGRVDDAYEATYAAGALGSQLGVEVAAAYRVGQLCVLDRERHGLAVLLEDLEEVTARLPYFVTIRALSALALATTDRGGDANWEIGRLSGHRFSVVPRDSLWVATIALLLEAAAISGSTHTATLVDLLTPYCGTFVVQGLPNCWGSVDRFVGRGRLALGNLAGAERSLGDALKLESDVGAPLLVARTMLDRARLAVRLGRARAAQEMASEVEANAERLELDALAAEARLVTGGLRRPAGLSRREAEVLALVAGGASNKEVAAALVISLNTVERHVANIYTKLGVRGRAEAAAYAVRTGLADLRNPRGSQENGGLP